MKAHFQNTFSFPMDFNDFMEHWGRIGFTWGHSWDHSEVTWRHLGGSGSPFGSTLEYFAVALGSIGAYEGHCGPRQRYGWYFGVTLTSLWDHFRIILGLLRVTLGPLQAHFGVLWGHFGVTLGHFQGAWGHFLSY